MNQTPILVFCHLRWNFVYQRPQHLLSCLARHRRILFIEEPLHTDEKQPFWETQNPQPNVTIYRPHTSFHTQGFHPEQISTMNYLLSQLLQKENLHEYVLWSYTPMALPLIENIESNARAIVYDCMDELSAFRGAPTQLIEHEKCLLQKADLVFTGGPSLYRAKKDRHPHVHCFSSSVDAPHFAAAKNSQIPEIDIQKNIPHPRLGFYGVIDERMDIDLLAAMAQAHPDWQIVMVGPVVKIPEASLPRFPNIHYFGQQTYQDLPRFLTGWDVCLLPFALNESTKFISPTKTLEYMAAEKPIVSTPITDVAEPYGDIVYLGRTPEEFIHACQLALAESAHTKQTHTEKMRAVLARTSWDTTVDSMRQLIDQAQVRRQHTQHQSSNLPPQASLIPPTQPAPTKPEKITTVVVGAGPTGLSATYHLGSDVLLLEQNDRIGGWCRSIQDHGFTFDYAGHIMFSNDPYVHEMYKMLLGDNIHWQNREAWIFSKGVYTRYPFQGALYGLPPEVIKECLVGAIEARFGNLKPPAPEPKSTLPKPHENGSPKPANNTAPVNKKRCAPDAKDLTDCCADGILESENHLSLPHQKPSPSAEPQNFEEFINKVWGRGIAKHFAIPYNRKLWAVDLKKMETSWLGGRVPLPDLDEMITGALSPVPAPMGPNARFGYPLKGGFQSLMNGFLPFIHNNLRLNTQVIAVSPSRHELSLSDGTRLQYEYFINTMPLPVLIKIMGEEAPPEIRAAANNLLHTSVRCVNIGVGREKITDKHWIYYPEQTVFHRIFVQSNASPLCNPPGGFGFTCEITYGPEKPLPCDGPDLIQRCIDDCRAVGFIRPDDPIWCSNQVDLPYAYVVYDHDRSKNVALIREWLAQQDILLAGRYSEWEYYNSDHAFIAGKKAAIQIAELQQAQDLADLSLTPRRSLTRPNPTDHSWHPQPTTSRSLQRQSQPKEET